MKEGIYYLYLTDDCVIDLATISDHDWDKLRKTVKLIIEANETKDVGKAYIAAFLLYAQDMGVLAIDDSSENPQ